MTKSKLSNKEIALSILIFIVCQILLLVTLFIMLVINTNGNVIPFILGNVNNVITVAVASVILTFIVYIYFFMENKGILASYGKIFEIFLLLYVALIATDVVGYYVGSSARPLLFFPLIMTMLFRHRNAIFLTFIYGLQVFIFNRFLNGDMAIGVTEFLGDHDIGTIDGFSGLLVMI